MTRLDSSPAKAPTVDFPMTSELTPGALLRVRVPSLLPNGEQPRTQLAVILGAHVACENMREFNEQRSSVLTIRAESVGAARLLVTQAGAQGIVQSASMTIRVLSVLTPPPLGSFGQGRFRNVPS